MAASAKLILTALALFCLFVPSHQECKCDIDLESSDLDDGIKCNGKTSDARKCFENCVSQHDTFKKFLKSLTVFEETACEAKMDKETTTGECWKAFFRECKGIVPDKEDEESCKSRKLASENCPKKLNDKCKPMAVKLAAAISAKCGKSHGNAGATYSVQLSILSVFVGALCLARW